MSEPAQPPSAWSNLALVMRSWRLLSVALLGFSSGLPLGLVWLAIPAWLARAGVDIKVVGLLTLAQAPWTFKLLWAPLMDRYPLPLLGRKRGYIFVSQAALVVLGLCFAAVADRPHDVWTIGLLSLATAFVSATQDIAYDAYTVEVLHRSEYGVSVGARLGLYRAAMIVSGGVSITLAGSTSWALAHVLLAVCYLPFMVVTWLAPEPETPPPPVTTLREAVWGPFLSLLAQRRALEILAFVVLYKLSDQLTQSLTRPFLIQVGFDDFDVGVATATIGQVAAIVGTVLGGLLTDRMGLGRALWVFGFLQIFSNLGYALVAQVGPLRPVMYAAQAFELLSTGLGSGAFGVLLLRLTQKKFSATQYAMLSALFTISRVLAGPPVALLAEAIGWRDFFIATIVTGIPGMLLLARFVPWRAREVEFHLPAEARGRPLSRRVLAAASMAAGMLMFASSLMVTAGIGAAGRLRSGQGWDFTRSLLEQVRPQTLARWISFSSALALGLGAALATAATLAARRGIRRRPDR